MFRMGIWRTESNNVCMNVRWLLLTTSFWRLVAGIVKNQIGRTQVAMIVTAAAGLLVRVLIGCYDSDTSIQVIRLGDSNVIP